MTHSSHHDDRAAMSLFLCQIRKRYNVIEQKMMKNQLVAHQRIAPQRG